MYRGDRNYFNISMSVASLSLNMICSSGKINWSDIGRDTVDRWTHTRHSIKSPDSYFSPHWPSFWMTTPLCWETSSMKSKITCWLVSNQQCWLVYAEDYYLTWARKQWKITNIFEIMYSHLATDFAKAVPVRSSGFLIFFLWYISCCK